jgi:uncharacterized Zn finger protein
MRESAEAKGRRYVTEGRLVVRLVDGHQIEAECRGSGEVYRLGYRPGSWWCECPAVGRCSHLVALQLVCVSPRAEVSVAGSRMVGELIT